MHGPRLAVQCSTIGHPHTDLDGLLQRFGVAQSVHIVVPGSDGAAQQALAQQAPATEAFSYAMNMPLAALLEADLTRAGVVEQALDADSAWIARALRTGKVRVALRQLGAGTGPKVEPRVAHRARAAVYKDVVRRARDGLERDSRLNAAIDGGVVVIAFRVAIRRVAVI